MAIALIGSCPASEIFDYIDLNTILIIQHSMIWGLQIRALIALGQSGDPLLKVFEALGNLMSTQDQRPLTALSQSPMRYSMPSRVATYFFRHALVTKRTVRRLRSSSNVLMF